MRDSLYGFSCDVFFPCSILPGVSGRGCVPETFPPGEGAGPEAGWKEKGGVYRPEDAFQLLLLTPFQSKLLGLFKVTSSGQSTVGFAVSSEQGGENSTSISSPEMGNVIIVEEVPFIFILQVRTWGPERLRKLPKVMRVLTQTVSPSLLNVVCHCVIV